jgi:cytochrome c-type biogenesis protein CcmH
VLGITLLIGSGVFSATPTTPAERAAAIDARLKAPDSQGLSVAQSNSAAAAAVRHEVRTEVDQGRSDEEIVASLEARYGNAVLLTPPGGGLATVLWVVPALLLLAIAIAVIVVARRRRLGSEDLGG